MKKFIITLCIILSVGIVVSLVGIIILAGNGGVDMTNYEKIEKTETLSPNGKIEISGKVESIKVYETEGDKLQLSYYEGKRLTHTYASYGGNVTLKTDFKSWFFEFMFLFKSDELTISVGVPHNFCGELVLFGETGKIDVNGIKNLKSLNAKVTTGSVSVKKVTAEKCYLETTTGSVNGNELFVNGEVGIKSTTGNIAVSGLTTNGLLKTEITTGRTKIDADCKIARIKSTTGDVDISIKTAEEIEIRSTTGSVTGKINGSETDFDIETSTTTGSCNLMNRSKEGGRKLRVTTTTGSVSLRFVNE